MFSGASLNDNAAIINLIIYEKCLRSALRMFRDRVEWYAEFGKSIDVAGLGYPRLSISRWRENVGTATSAQ